MKEPATDEFVLEMAIEPRARDDRDVLASTLAKYAALDPRIGCDLDPESGQLILKGTSELQLDDVIDRLKRLHNIEVNCSAPQVAYRETIARRAECTYRHRRQPLSSGLFAKVDLIVEPRGREAGNTFIPEIEGGIVPDACVAAIEQGIRSRLDGGVAFGFPMVDVCVRLVEIEYNDFASAEKSLAIAARGALAEACNKAGAIVLEPIMQIEITTPANTLGSVLADILRRRGELCSQSMRGDTMSEVSAHVPLGSLFGYDSSIKSISNGCATYSMRYSHYAAVPRSSDGGDDNFPPAVGMRG